MEIQLHNQDESIKVHKGRAALVIAGLITAAVIFSVFLAGAFGIIQEKDSGILSRFLSGIKKGIGTGRNYLVNYLGTGSESGESIDNSGGLSDTGEKQQEQTGFAGDILPALDSTYSLGAIGNEWANLYVDTVGAATLNVSEINTDRIIIGNSGLWVGTDQLVVSGGRTGVGTTSPQYKLDVAGDINFSGSLFQNGSVFQGSENYWTQNGKDIYYTGGSVGIGTTNPRAELDVRGEMKLGSDGDEFVITSKGIVTDGTWKGDALGTTYGGTNWNSSSASGMAQVVSGSWGAVTGTTNYVGRWTDANTLGIGTLYDNGTSVGIGTATPGAKLDIRGGIAAGTNGTKFVVSTGGVITTGTWNGTAIGTVYGGLGANVTAAGAGEILYSTAATTYGHLAAGTSGQALISGGAGAPSWGTLGTTYGGTNWNSSSASGMAQVVSGSWGAVTGTTNYAAYWSDENTISAEQYLAVTRGGTGAGTFTGVLKGNGTGAFTAMTGTPNYVTRWTDANTLGIGTLYDNGTSVGIGTATPGALFEVYGSSTQFRLYYNANGPLSGYADFSVGSGGNLTIQPTGTSATTTIGTGSTILAVDSTGVKPGTDNNYDLGSADYRFRDLYLGPGSLKMYNSWTDAANYELGKLSFNTNVLTLATSAAGSGTVRSVHITTGANTGLYVISSGNVGIGTTSPGYLLQMEASGGGYYDVTDHSWHNGSSIRFKEDIQPLGGALSTIRQIQGVRYNWKEQYGGAADIGFIAEDLGQVLPEVVSWDPKNPGYANGISYGKITALLLEGVKEIDELLAPLDIDESGNLGLGTTESRARLEARAVSGPQLNLSRDAGNYTEFETGADGNLTVSPSGGKMTVAGQLDASSGGIVTKVVSGEVTDSNFEIDTDGAIAIDSANGRIYFRYGGNWHYADKAGGFQIPNYETAPYEDLPKKARQSKQAALPFEESSFDDYLTQRLMPGDFLIPYVDEYLPDGAAHGLYARFNDVKGKMFKEEQEQLVDLAVKMDKNVTSLGEMQDLVEDNFGILGADLESLKDKVEEVDWLAVSNEEEIAALKGKAAVASVDIDGLKDGLISAEEKIDSVEKKIASLEELVKGKGNETGAELDILTGLIDSFGENGTFSVSGSVALAGKLDAEQVVTSILAIRNESEEIKVIGEEEILPVATDEDGDGYDDANGADGKGVIISTSAISETCKIFISFEDDPGSASWVEKTKIPPETDKYNGFIIRLGEPIKQKTKVSWWIVEKEKNE